MIRSSFYFAALITFAWPSSAIAQEDTANEVVKNTEELKPLTPWGLDYGEDKCRLARLFGSEQDRHVLLIEQSWPSSGFTLIAAGSSFRRFRRGTTIFVGMQGDVPMRRTELPPTANLAEFGPTIILSLGLRPKAQDAAERLLIGPDADDASQSGPAATGLDPDEGAKIDRVILKRRRGKPVSFETGNLEDAFKAINSCTTDLLSSWGLDPEKHRSFTRANWLNEERITKKIMDDYPADALSEGEQAIFRMRVIIDEQGAVAECKISAATTTEELESPACKAMQGARFSPALDAEGMPMRSFFATSVSYRISS